MVKSLVVSVPQLNELTESLSGPDWYGISANAFLALLVALFAQRVLARQEMRRSEKQDIRRFNSMVAQHGSFLETVVFFITQLIMEQYEQEKRYMLALSVSTNWKDLAENSPPIKSVPQLPDFEPQKYFECMPHLSSQIQTMLTICRLGIIVKEFNAATEDRNILGRQLFEGITCERKEDLLRYIQHLNQRTTILVAHAESLLDASISISHVIADMNTAHHQTMYELGVKNISVSCLIPNETHYQLLKEIRDIVDSFPDHGDRYKYTKSLTVPKFELISFHEKFNGIHHKIRQLWRSL